MAGHAFRTVVRVRQLVAGLGAVPLAVLAGCSGGGGDASQGTADETLTVAVPGPPLSMDPSRADNGFGLYPLELAYEPLIRRNYDGTFAPGLAKSWRYVGDGNKKFELTIRDDARFSDGTAVTPKAVADSLQYFTSGTGPTVAALAGVTAKVTGPHKVTLTSTRSNPVLPLLLSEAQLAGDIISPAGLAKPKSLTAKPSGAGAYVLDTAATVTGQQYTFVPNKRYFEPDRIHYKKIVIKVIKEPTARLSALRTGKIDLMTGNARQVNTVKSAGLQVQYTGTTAWNGVVLMDRDGKLVKALADVRVRRALNYAVDRTAIAKAVWGTLGTPDHQPAASGQNGYVPSLAEHYDYDPAKAKRLLAQAGYPDGFTMGLEYAAYEPHTQQMVQAFAQQLSAIGVTVKLKAEPTVAALASDLSTRKYSAVSIQWGAQNMYFQVGSCWLPKSVLNPFQVDDKSFVDAFHAAASAPLPEVDSEMSKLGARVVKDAYTVPIAQIKGVLFTSPGLTGLPTRSWPVNLLEVTG